MPQPMVRVKPRALPPQLRWIGSVQFSSSSDILRPGVKRRAGLAARDIGVIAANGDAAGAGRPVWLMSSRLGP